jgi:hypothetical protein
MLKIRSLLLAEIESAYNSDPTPTGAANAMLVENLSWSHEGARRHERSGAVKGTMAPLRSLHGGSLIGLTFDVEIKGSGSAGTAPEYGPLLKACGFEETIVASTSVTYTPSSDPADHKSVTCYVYEDGTLYQITGCRGQFTVDLTVGAAGKLSFKLIGHLAGKSDTSLASPTLQSNVPPVVLGASFAVDSYSAIISKLTIDPGITVVTPDNLAAADGYGEIRITGMAPTFTIDPEQTVFATYDWLAKWQANGSGSMTTGTIGSTAGNRYTITAPAAVYTELSNGDRNGILTREVKGMLVDTTSDNWISIALT